MRRRSVLALLVGLPLLLAVDKPNTKPDDDPQPPPGAIRLMEGYRHQRLLGFDTAAGRIWKEGGLEITYDIGGRPGNRANDTDVDAGDRVDRAWSMKQVVNGRPVKILKTKDGVVSVRFAAVDGKKTAEAYPATFHAKVSSEEDLAALLAITLTYPAVSKREDLQ